MRFFTLITIAGIFKFRPKIMKAFSAYNPAKILFKYTYTFYLNTYYIVPFSTKYLIFWHIESYIFHLLQTKESVASMSQLQAFNVLFKSRPSKLFFHHCCCPRLKFRLVCCSIISLDVRKVIFRACTCTLLLQNVLRWSQLLNEQRPNTFWANL